MAKSKRASERGDNSGGLREFARESQLAELKVQHEREIRSLRAEAAENKAQAKALLERVEEQDAELNAHAHAIRDRRAPKPIKARKKSSAVSESTLVVLASDWHVEELVEAKTVGGRNAYTPEIARARAEEFFRRVVGLGKMARSHTRCENLVLPLLGDFITGHIHDEMKETTAMAPLEAIDFAADLLRSGIEYLEDKGGFERIVIPTTFGNHGRLSPKPYYSKAAVHNLEWFMYGQLARHFAGRQSVEFVVSAGRYNEEVEVYGRRLRFHHGEDLKFAGGLQGFFGRLYKLHLEKNQTRPCYWTCVGHWHRAHAFRRIGMVNGSLIGDSPYGERFGSEAPQQVFGLIEKDRGCTMTGPVFVEAP